MSRQTNQAALFLRKNEELPWTFDEFTFTLGWYTQQGIHSHLFSFYHKSVNLAFLGILRIGFSWT